MLYKRSGKCAVAYYYVYRGFDLFSCPAFLT